MAVTKNEQIKTIKNITIYVRLLTIIKILV